MLLSLKRPSQIKLSSVLAKKDSAYFNYSEQGGTKEICIDGFDNDHTFDQICNGQMYWNRAKSALTNWKHFPPKWTFIYNRYPTIKEEQTVGVIFKLFGLWWVNSARIVYTINETNKFGFAYGTLKGHVEKGEECFWIEMDKDENITYHIKAFSKPDFWGAKLLYPLARKYQRKFVRDSISTMKNIWKE